MNILITGSNGVLGGHITRVLSSKHKVIRLERSGNAEIVADLLKLAENDITELFKKHKIDTIVHCAADVTTSTVEGFYLNSSVMQKFFTHRDGKSKRYVLIGSGAEYGQGFLPLSNYAASKLLQTSLAFYNREQFGINVQVVRIFNPVAPQLRKGSFIAHVLDEVVKGDKGVIKLDNDMKQRDFIDMRDVGAAITAIIEKPDKKFLYDIGTGISVTFKDFLGEVKAVLDAQGKEFPKVISEKSVQTSERAADIKDLKKDYGWSPKYTLRDSIEWCLKEKQYL